MKNNKRRQLAISGFFLVLSFNFSFIQFANAADDGIDSILKAQSLAEFKKEEKKQELTQKILDARKALEKCKAQKSEAACAEEIASLKDLNDAFNAIVNNSLDKTPGSYSQDYQDLSEDLEGKQQQWQSDSQWKTKYSSTAEEKKCKGAAQILSTLSAGVDQSVTMTLMPATNNSGDCVQKRPFVSPTDQTKLMSLDRRVRYAVRASFANQASIIAGASAALRGADRASPARRAPCSSPRWAWRYQAH